MDIGAETEHGSAKIGDVCTPDFSFTTFDTGRIPVDIDLGCPTFLPAEQEILAVPGIRSANFLSTAF
jgi:hypothetical protein